MKSQIRNILLLVLIPFLFTCSNAYYYKQGLKAARDPSISGVNNHLTTLTTVNKDLVWDTIGGRAYVLMASWKADTTYYTKNFDKATGFYQL